MSRAIFKLGLGGRALIKSVTLTASGGSTGGGNPYTFSTQSIGAAPSGSDRRYIIAIGHANDSGSATISSMTLGSAMTMLKNVQGGTAANCAIAMLEKTDADTTATLVINTSAGMDEGGFGLIRVITGPGGLSLINTAQDTSGDVSMSLTGQVGDAIIAGLTAQNGSGAPDNFTGVTHLYNTEIQVSPAAYSLGAGEVLTSGGVKTAISGTKAATKVAAAMVLLRPS